MPFEDQSFDCVLDKGTVDALSCGDAGRAAMQLIAEVTLIPICSPCSTIDSISDAVRYYMCRRIGCSVRVGYSFW